MNQIISILINNFKKLNSFIMEKDWKQVFLTGEMYQAEIARELLENVGINSVIINQKDSVYQTFGDIELYVNEADESSALEILKQLKN
jgi:hypothetical protein